MPTCFARVLGSSYVAQRESPDDLTLSFHAVLPGVRPGEHRVGVRAVDLAGNSVTRATRVMVPATR